jgi:hypothetical protein
MCGRATYKLTWEEIVALYRLTPDQPPVKLPRRNTALALTLPGAIPSPGGRSPSFLLVLSGQYAYKYDGRYSHAVWQQTINEGRNFNDAVQRQVNSATLGRCVFCDYSECRCLGACRRNYTRSSWFSQPSRRPLPRITATRVRDGDVTRRHSLLRNPAAERRLAFLI